jgi:hypothetical protein
MSAEIKVGDVWEDELGRRLRVAKVHEKSAEMRYLSNGRGGLIELQIVSEKWRRVSRSKEVS